MQKLTLTNKDGKIVACLYIDKEGNLHCDSWLCEKGWPPESLREDLRMGKE